MLNTRPAYDLQIGGRKVSLGRHTLIMGVVNVTPDSFSDGGVCLSPDPAIGHALELVRQGAHWIDIGGESTRPGAEPVSVEEELRRVLPVIRGLRREMGSLPISIDTTKSRVAQEALRAGATIINDISGLRFDPAIAVVARRHCAPLILMHLRKRPPTMQLPPFPHSIWQSVERGLQWSLRKAVSLGARRSHLIVDPGLGFGKTRRQNFEIVSRLERLHRLGLPVMVGASRKSFVQAIAAGEKLDPSRRNVPAASTSNSSPAGIWPLTTIGHVAPVQVGDAAMVTAAILAGVHIVRVHDVEAILPAVRIADALLEARSAS